MGARVVIVVIKLATVVEVEWSSFNFYNKYNN